MSLKQAGRGVVLLLLGWTGTVGGQPAPIIPGTTVRLVQVADIPAASGGPNYLFHAPDTANRLFVTAQNGDVHLIKEGALADDPFLNFGEASITLATGGERGLLGMAFHPNYFGPLGSDGSGKFYTYTSEPKSGTPDFNHPELVPGNLGDHHSVIREWSVDPANPDAIDLNATSRRELMRINQPQSNHNGGALAFGPDDNLYISLGDGGGGGDFFGSMNSLTDGHTNGGVGNAQDITNVYGSILRIDPLGNNSTNGKYGVPSDNPFFGATAGVDEIFAYGLRNPFRMSFDRLMGDLYAGDVGQGQREEVDLVTSGGNYGWVYFEGTRLNRTPPSGFTSIAPIGEYTHADGVAVIGGFVYRGSLLDAELGGDYIFGDLAGGSGAGRLFHMDVATGQISEFAIQTSGVDIPGQLYGFGEDHEGELYALFASGEVLAIKPACVPGDIDCDGDVDFQDFLVLQAYYFTTSGARWSDGNFDGDQDVDFADFLILQSNYGSMGENLFAAAAHHTALVVTPEPSSVALVTAVVPLLIAHWLIGGRRRRRRHSARTPWKLP